MATAITLRSLDLTLRRDLLSLRRCKRCGREWPGYLERCRLCPAILGEPYGREILLIVPDLEPRPLPPRALPAAALALELSGTPTEEETLRAEARRTLAVLADVLPPEVTLRTLPNGTIVAVDSNGPLCASADRVARAAAALEGRGPLELRSGIAVGLVDGSDPARAMTVARAATLARAAQAGQTLVGYGSARLLDRDWQFAPAGALPRREVDAVGRTTSFLGRKPPVPTPSALAADHEAQLVGRAGELAALDHELARVRAGEGRWCAVVAPAGSGKSILLRSWLGRLTRQGLRLAGAAATPFGQAPGALVDQLLRALGVPLRARGEAELATSLQLVLGRSAREEPLLVVIDDLHWADADSLAALYRLGEHPLGRCLVVVALRSSFVPAVPWLLERARCLTLPPLGPSERSELLRRLLPGESAAPLRAQLASARDGSNPLYLEQATAYLRDAGSTATAPRSLHEAVLQRLELVRRSIDRRGFTRPSKEELAAAERTVGEWLDRLETEDYGSRNVIAEYLSLLEHIDAALVIAGSIAGVPQRRNRRLGDAIERFYSASFAERSEAIARLAAHDPMNAAVAAERGAQRALAAVRLDDAIGYLQQLIRLTHGDVRARHLLGLGDVLLVRGLSVRAWHAYAAAIRTSGEPQARARCQFRLGHVALVQQHPRLASSLLQRALPGLPAHERLSARCDLALAHARSGGRAAITSALRDLEDAGDAAHLVPVLQARLRLALLGAPAPRDRVAQQCVDALVLEDEPVANLAAIVETTVLLLEAQPALTGPELLGEAAKAVRRLGLDANCVTKPDSVRSRGAGLSIWAGEPVPGGAPSRRAAGSAG